MENKWIAHYKQMVEGKLPNKPYYILQDKPMQSGEGDIKMISPSQQDVERAKMVVKRKIDEFPLHTPLKKKRIYNSTKKIKKIKTKSSKSKRSPKKSQKKRQNVKKPQKRRQPTKKKPTSAKKSGKKSIKPMKKSKKPQSNVRRQTVNIQRKLKYF